MLARIRKARENGESGFTLIELLVVMIIIGILAAIAIPVFLSQKNKAYATSAKSDLRSAAQEVEAYLSDNTVSATVAIGAGTTASTFKIGTVDNLGRLDPNTALTGQITSQTAYCMAAVNRGQTVYYTPSAQFATTKPAGCP